MIHKERASSSGELVVLFPVLMMIVLLVVYVGRLTHTSISLQHVAEVAAREASMSSRRLALSTAISSSQRELHRNDLHCVRTQVTTEEFEVSRGRSIRVHLVCKVSSKDIGLLNLLPMTIRVDALSVVDRYRGE